MTPPDSSAYWTPALPLIAILRGIRPGEALAHVEVLIDAGFDAIEMQTIARAGEAAEVLGPGHVDRAQRLQVRRRPLHVEQLRAVEP